MGKKALSDMSAQAFVEVIGALGGQYNLLHRKLGRTRAMLSRYANGHSPIPVEIVDKLGALINERVESMKALGHTITDTRRDQLVSKLIVISNEVKAKAPQRLPFLMRRDKPEDTRVYPAYRMQYQRFAIFAEALGAWHIECTARRQGASDIRDIKALDRELADLKVLAGNVQGLLSRGAPYDMYITFSEWFVVSRILRHETTDAKYSLYQHWRHHKGAGFPRVRGSDAQTQP